MMVKVIYDGKLDIALDEKIRKAMESINMEWCAQGKASDGYRDICFDYNPSENKSVQPVDKILKAADDIAEVFDLTQDWLDRNRSKVVKILKNLVAEKSNNNALEGKE